MDTPHILSREDVLAAEAELPTETVEVPEWGGSVIVRGMTGAGRDAFERTLVEQRGKRIEGNFANFRAKLIVQSVIDEKGRLLFTEKDIPELGRKSAAALERVYSTAQRLSRLLPEDVEELTEALGEDTNGDSGSGSPDTLVTLLSEPPSELSDPTSSPNGSPTTSTTRSETSDSTSSSRRSPITS